MSNTHIELNRSFAPVSKESAIGEEDYDLSNALGLLPTKKWECLLNLHRVIILAEAGAGKTEEMKAVTQRLRTDGKQAFFLRLEHLCSGLETSFDIGSLDEFTAWLSSNKEGWFFLDSVDEARLKGVYQFEHAIRMFAYKLGDNIERAHIFVTSRVSEWRQKTDLALIMDKLPFKKIDLPEQDKTAPQNQPKQLRNNALIKSESNLEPSIFLLCPLNDDQILIYARCLGVSDANKFLVEIQKKEAASYAGRPLDLSELIDFWKKHGNIGNHYVMLQESISHRLKEWKPDHDVVFPLTDDEARGGAEMLAATVTLRKKNRISVIDGNTVSNEEVIDPREVLSSWGNNKITALLQRPIFDGAIYGTVRFHHRSAREYLTAQWLLRLLQEGKSRRAVEALIFAERYGEQVILPSMRPIVAWLLLWDDQIREKAIEISPEVLIQGGDPSSLPTAVRKNALENYCKRYAYHKNGRFSFDLTALRRFAHQDMASTIKQLLIDYRENKELCCLLFQMIWQGDIAECSDEALATVLDNSRDYYTRIYCIRIISAVGSTEQKEKLKSFFVRMTASNDGALIGELINAFIPPILTVQDVLSLIKTIEVDAETQHLNTTLHSGLKEVVNNQWSMPDVFEFIRGISLLLEEPPIIEKTYFEVSQRYCWLIPFACLAMERLIQFKDENVFNESALSVLSLLEEERMFGRHFHVEEHSLEELVLQWPELNYALFWFDVVSLRKRMENNERLTNGWYLRMRGHYWKFTTRDFDSFIEDVSNKSFIDDRLIALSEAFEIYKESGREAKYRKKLKEAVSQEKELEVRLAGLFHPPPMPPQVRKARLSNKSFQKKQVERKKKEADDREKWRAWLREHITVLRDTSIAHAGKVWTATNHLMHEIWNKQKSHNQWARAEWEVLIPEFGQEVAEAYRDGCVDYWRKYIPKIQSAEKEDLKDTPVAVIIGLSGLMIEAQDSDWTKELSEDEAKLACRYAVIELNGFPIWLQNLHKRFPLIIEGSILTEIEWEFTRVGDITTHYMLDDVNYHADWLKQRITPQILSFLEKYEPRHDDTVKRSLEIVFVNEQLDKNYFISIARIKIGSKISDERKALWFAAWMAVESVQALKELEKFLSSMSDAKSATTFAIIFLVELLGNRREGTKKIYSDYKKTSSLFSLYRMMHMYIRPSEDIQRKGCYSPGPRDDAQDARERLVQLLQEIPGKETYLALVELSNEHPNKDLQDWYAGLARRRAEMDAEAVTWHSRDVSIFAKEVEKNPTSHRELFDLLVSRLFDLKDEFENGAMSNAATYQTITIERQHRIYIGGRLSAHSVGRYSVASENELADATRPDFYVFSNAVVGEVPIELKIACSYTTKILEERLRNQLCGQYLRDVRSNCGVFLLMYCGQKTYWEHPTTKEKMDFDQLIEFLENVAFEVVQKDKKIESVKVIGIDLKKRMIPSNP